MPAKIKDIAASLGLSVATVSRALHDESSPFVSDKTRRRVREAARRMGYRTNHAARALATGRTHMFGLWVHTLYTPYYAKIGRCLHRLASRRQYQLVARDLILDGLDPDQFAPVNWAMDGILTVDARGPVQTYIQASIRSQTPLVNMGALYTEALDFVGVDISKSAVEAVEHLLACGAKRVALLTDQPSDPRRTAYLSVMERAGRPPEIVPIPNQERPAVRAFLRQYVEAKGCPEALFCHNDDVAIGAYRALHDLGVRVPDEAAIVGCDGIEDTEFLETPISTIVQPVEEMCALAWEFLENRINAPTLPVQQTVLQSHLVVRESSRR